MHKVDDLCRSVMFFYIYIKQNDNFRIKKKIRVNLQIVRSVFEIPELSHFVNDDDASQSEGACYYIDDINLLYAIFMSLVIGDAM